MHTPGPWHANPTLASQFHKRIPIQGDDAEIIALVALANDSRASSIARQVDNTELIAAAPDLLDALTGALEWLEALRDSECRHALLDCQPDGVGLKKLRAAITKATGE